MVIYINSHKHGGDIYRNKNVIDFSANCNPFGTPDSVKKAVALSMERISDYPDTQCEELIKALSEYEDIPEEYFICGNGAADLIFQIALAKGPSKALIPAPTFAEYEQALATVKCGIERYYLKEENDFVPDESILDMITDDIDIMFICNPNNPTGVITEQKLLLKILEKCSEKNVFLVLDECFTDFLDDPSGNTLKAMLKEYRNLFILKAFTKRYAMAGIRLGYGLTSDSSLISRMNEISQPWNVSVLAQAAGVAALKEEEYVKTSMEYLKKEREFLNEGIKEAGFKTYNSKANYIFFKADENLYDYCLEKGILIRNCGNYHGLEKGYYRVAVKLRKDNEKLIKILKEYEV